MKVFLLTTFLVLYTITTAFADCTIVGTLVSVSVLDETRKDMHTLYVREFQSDPHFYVFDTSNLTVASVALNLVAMQTRIQLRGDEFSCPSEGQERYAGVLLELIANP